MATHRMPMNPTVWMICPKVMHMGKTSVDTACALAVCSFNNGVSSFQAISERLN